jgi:sugar phosphate isomerase/epimerase
VTRPIGLQLYTLRQALEADFEGTLRQVADAGYVGVELAGLYGRAPRDAASLLQSLGLEIVAMHCRVLTPEDLQNTLAEAAALNCQRLVCPWVQPDHFASLERIHQLAEALNAAASAIAAEGRALYYHNHDFELQQVAGKPALSHFVAALDPRIGLELDTYWVAVGGADPLALLAGLGDRVGLVHIKDGAINPARPMLAVGDGAMDYKAIIPALPAGVPSLLVELDECATDMMEAVRRSADYLVREGLGHGR